MLDALLGAQRLGYLGPSPVESHVEHGLSTAVVLAEALRLGFEESADGAPLARVLDLGSGGGVPGLVLATVGLSVEVTLLEASSVRAEYLRSAVARLAQGHRTCVIADRAEVAGHKSEFRERFDAVVARSFGRPAVTAECGGPFVRLGGILVVSEPPDAGVEPRWPASDLAVLGLLPEARPTGPFARFQLLRKVGACEPRYPRRTGIPAKRPLF
ncbi:MAG: RsmG family class I SAM-dependent methyltransferase [Acidimicrobiales bacterium]